MLNPTKRLTDTIIRDPQAFAQDRYDLIVIGGGIYGTMLTLEASRRQLTCLLLERDDFGSHTSFNHLRILHGGLRYLQTMDLHRYFDSVGERSWFLRFFPGLTHPLDCLMPLCGKGLKRPFFLNLALTLDTLLAWHCNHRIPQNNRLNRGRVLSVKELQDQFPDVLPNQVGAALWQDGFVPDSPRLIIELLRWACSYGGRALNYCTADELLTVNGRVLGVRTKDRISGMSHEFKAPLVINAAGPWSSSLANAWHGDGKNASLFPNRILVWNLLFRRAPLAKSAVALTPPNYNHTYFSVPWKNQMLVGTGHLLLKPDEHRPPTKAEIDTMINHLNDAVPCADLDHSGVQRVLWGVMPGTPDCQLAKRPIYRDHGNEGGPKGLVSISGVKFTTARRVADQLLTKFLPTANPIPYGDKFAPSILCGQRGLEKAFDENVDWNRLVFEESAQNLADLVLRRTTLIDSEDLDRNILSKLASLFSTNPKEQKSQINEVLHWSDMTKPEG